MPKFRKKPVEIEAVKFEGDFDVIRKFVGPENLLTAVISADSRIDGQVWDRRHSTWVGFGLGDSIIRGVQGEFYPCKEEVFAATYEPVEPS